MFTTDSLGKKWSSTIDQVVERLVNDKVRVYKGGSWRDRAYWLDPAQLFPARYGYWLYRI
jgi:hypothetical protein